MSHSFKHKIFQIRIADLSYKISYLKDFIGFLKENDFSMIYLDFGTNFPFKSFPCLRNDCKYSREEIKELCSHIDDLSLDLMITGLSFSHSANFLKYDEFKPYQEANSGNLELTDDKSLELIIKQGEDILELCPSLKILHVGGDEMFNLGSGEKSASYILKHGKSKLYVEFVNRIVTHFAKKNVKIAIWSDMIIRYYEEIDSLDKQVLIFYWDYWSYGERIPFLTIGGGCLDTFVLDRAALNGDLEKLLRWRVVRERSEIPIGHLEYFEKYYQLDDERKSAKAFPYLAWFNDKGFETICAFLPYTEKGTIFPNMGEKIEHIKGFLSEGERCDASGYMFCLWQPFWPLLELYKIAVQSIKFYNSEPEISENTLFGNLEKDCNYELSSDTIRDIYSCSVNFEFSDVLNPSWGSTPFSDRIKMINNTKSLEDENKKTRHVIAYTERLLNNPEIQNKSDFLHFSLKEINWRARCQELCLIENGDIETKKILLKEGESLLVEYRTWIKEYFLEDSVDYLIEKRWNNIFNALN